MGELPITNIMSTFVHGPLLTKDNTPQLTHSNLYTPPPAARNFEEVGKHRVLFAAGVAAAGLALSVLLWWSAIDRIAAGRNDFAAFYAGARLAGTADLYHAPNIMRVKAEAADEYGNVRQYIRLPYFAALLWPLGRLPYLWAYRTFQAASLAALLAFLLLWPDNRLLALVACCWSVPVSATFAQGQDAVFLLLWVALLLRWHETRPFAAGLALALCAAKFHLFLHVPLVLAAHRKWRTGGGLLLGGAALAVVSFAVAGADWPGRFLAAASSSSVSPAEDAMPNLHNLLRGVPMRGLWEAASAAVCAALVWVVARRSSFDFGIAAALIAGLLTSVHAYHDDCVLLIPAALILYRAGVPWMRMAAAASFIPVWYLFLHVGSSASRVVPAGLLLLLGGMAWAMTAFRARAAAQGWTK